MNEARIGLDFCWKLIGSQEKMSAVLIANESGNFHMAFLYPGSHDSS